MIISIIAKVSQNEFTALLKTSKGKQVGRTYSGPPPSWMPGKPNMVELDINVKNGKVMNWRPMAKEELARIFGPEVYEFKM